MTTDKVKITVEQPSGINVVYTFPIELTAEEFKEDILAAMMYELGYFPTRIAETLGLETEQEVYKLYTGDRYNG